MQNDSSAIRGIASLALALFVGGLLLPFILYAVLITLAEMTMKNASAISFGFGVVSECLACILGIVGRRHSPGKIAAIGSGVIAALAVGTVMLLLLIPSSK